MDTIIGSNANDTLGRNGANRRWDIWSVVGDKLRTEFCRSLGPTLSPSIRATHAELRVIFNELVLELP